jgi:hypothetical protein
MIRPLTILFGLTLCVASASPVLAGGTAATIPWGQWLTAVLSTASSVLVPVAAAAVTAGVAKVAPWATSILTRQRIESAIRAGVDYGQNAVAGAVRGRSVSVDLGPAVVAAGTKHVVATNSSGVVRKAGGVEGVAARVFQALPLEEKASAETVLAPALKILQVERPRRA